MENKAFDIVNGGILQEINRKKEILEKDPCFHLALSSKRKGYLQKESARHSVSIEMIGYYGNSSKERKLKAKEVKKAEKNLFNALNWGSENYKDKLNINYIERLGQIIEPEENRGGFRNHEIMISGSHILPPSPHKIRLELENLSMVNNHLSPIERVVHAHFHIARIHPFFDGNGRTARTLQNLILEKEGFLPITIKMKDRGEYIHLIKKAIESRVIAEGKLNSKQDEHYRECRRKLLDNEPLTESEKKYCCSVIADFSKNLLTPKVHEFYNFLALKERDALQAEQDRIYAKREKKKRS